MSVKLNSVFINVSINMDLLKTVTLTNLNNCSNHMEAIPSEFLVMANIETVQPLQL